MSEFLKTAIEAAKNAERVIMKHYSPDIAIEMKPDNTPVTAGDREAEEIIVKTIKEKFPEHGFIGEEGTSKEAEFKWIIDPIDGTTNYVRGMSYRCQSELCSWYRTQIAGIRGRWRTTVLDFQVFYLAYYHNSYLFDPSHGVGAFPFVQEGQR